LPRAYLKAPIFKGSNFADFALPSKVGVLCWSQFIQVRMNVTRRSRPDQQQQKQQQKQVTAAAAYPLQQWMLFQPMKGDTFQL